MLHRQQQPMYRPGRWLNRMAPAIRKQPRCDTQELQKHVEVAVIGIRGIPASYGGLELCAEQTTAYWASKNVRVLVYCRKSHYSHRPAAVGKVRLKYTASIPSVNLDTLSHTFVSIMDLLLRERHVRLVQLYNTGNAIFIPLLKLFGKRVVMTGDGLEWRREKWGRMAKIVHKLGERMAVLFADQLIIDNEEVRQYFLKKYSIKTTLIAYGANIIRRDDDRSRELLKKYELERKKYFIFVGRLVPEKGVRELIDAYNQLDTPYPLIILGDVNDSAYRDDLFSRQSDKVRFLGFIYGADYEQLLVNALIYVSASKLEGTSPSLLAAMGARVCALVNGIPENRSSAGDAACMFERDNFDDLRVKWQQLADKPGLIDEAAERGYRHVMERYQWNTIAERYLAVFNGIGGHPDPDSDPEPAPADATNLVP